jgi:V8-like Glu-specific endopeptidase
MGPFRYYDQDEPPNLDPWFASLRWTRVGQCRVLAKIDGCLQHTCQTFGGFSGAPILASREGNLVLVGIQSSLPRQTSECSSDESGDAYNIGVSSNQFAALIP